MNFTKNLLAWYHENKRDLPWRETRNPYFIWLSEIILQQTRIEQGLPYYQKFIENFPSLENLAKADENKVLNLWQGLGYYSRARNLHATAKTIYFELNNKFPAQYRDIISLKGIGPYTAAAIASFAYKEPVGVVDGNVYRLIARYFGIYDDISATKSRSIFQNLVNEIIDKKNPDLFNHAIMDFGATVCTPKKPLCESCIFNANCVAFLKNETHILPIKIKKNIIKNRYFHFIIHTNNENLIIEQRTKKDIWEKLFQLPLVETTNENTEINYKTIEKQYPNNSLKPLNHQPIKHKLSHQHLHIFFYETSLISPAKHQKNIPIETLPNYGFPIVIWNFLKEYFKLDKI